MSKQSARSDLPTASKRQAHQGDPASDARGDTAASVVANQLAALAGVLLATVEQAGEKPETVATWAERGEKFFRGDGKSGGRGKRTGTTDAAPGASSHGAPAAPGSSPAP